MKLYNSLFNKSNTSVRFFNTSRNDKEHKNCSCKRCDPNRIIEGWTSGNSSIDKFIKDTMNDARREFIPRSIEWVPFDTFTDIKQIGEGGFAKVYSATWIDGKKAEYEGWKKLDSKPVKVALKRLNGSQNISDEYLNKIKTHWASKFQAADDIIAFGYWDSSNYQVNAQQFYGITQYPETKEYMMILQFANKGNLRNILSSDFNNMLWKDRICLLYNLSCELRHMHKLGYFHKDFNILNVDNSFYISDFGLYGSADEEKSDDKIYGVLPYIAPEVLSGEPYKSSSDIYSFGVVMAELSGIPPFHDKKHDLSLVLDIFNGSRPEFVKGTPGIFKKLAYKCMNANSIQRPTADELYIILRFWYDSINGKFYHNGKEIKDRFEEADKEIQNIPTSYEKDPDAVYTSRVFTFNNLPNPINPSYFDKINYESCSYCSTEKELWCYKCDPHCIIEGWTSGNSNIDRFIKDTMYDARNGNSVFLEWVPFDEFTDIKQIDEGGFAKVYSATWMDESMKVALKRLNGSQNMSAEYLNKLKIHWNVSIEDNSYLKFYGITKDPETKDFMIIMQFANKGNLRNILSRDFNNILWKDKIRSLWNIILDLKHLHNLEYFHKDFHSGNILQNNKLTHISDFGLSGPANKQKSDDKIYGVLPYIAPEVLNKEPYTSSSDIYCFGVVMAELSSGIPPYYNRKHNLSLSLDICNGLRPEFGNGTPEIYKKVAHSCMNSNPNQRPTADELYNILKFWHDSINGKFNYKGKEIGAKFKEADKEIPNISTSHEKDPDAIYTSQTFKFHNLPKPVNSAITTSYLEEDINKDSQLVDLDIMKF